MPTDLSTEQIKSQKDNMNTTLKSALDTFTSKIITYFANTKSLEFTPSNENNQSSAQTPDRLSIPPEINVIIAQQLIEMADTAGVLQNDTSINQFLQEIAKDITHFYQVIALPSHSTETPTKSAAHSSEQENSSQIQTAFDELKKNIRTIGTFECLDTWQAATPEPVDQAII